MLKLKDKEDEERRTDINLYVEQQRPRIWNIANETQFIHVDVIIMMITNMTDAECALHANNEIWIKW